MQNTEANPKGTSHVFAITAAAAPLGFPSAKEWIGFKGRFPGKLEMEETSPFGTATGIKIVLFRYTTLDYLLSLQTKTAP